MEREKPRWIYRFDNFARALALLREAVETMQVRELSQLEKEGLVQRFEYTWELAWKVLKDYLESQGVVLATVTPGSVIRAAYAAKIIADGDTWMRALDARNRMSLTYSLKAFEQIIADIRQHYRAALEALEANLATQARGMVLREPSWLDGSRGKPASFRVP